MASLTYVYVNRNKSIKHIPELYSKISIVYIQDSNYSYDVGGETGSNYFLVKNGKLYGQIHKYMNKLVDIDSQLNINNELRLSLLRLPSYKVVKVGEFEVIKIIFYGNNTIKYSIRGLPKLYNLYFADEETTYIQNNY